MKKNRDKKLNLNSETLRRLTDNMLHGVFGGGGGTKACTGGCPAETNSCTFTIQ
jgi:hypothetical protein